MKFCRRCETLKRESEFAKASRQPDGLQGHCKECNRSYRLANRESIREYQREYAFQNSETAVARANAWRKANGNQAKISQRKHNHKRRALLRTNGNFSVTCRDLERLCSKNCFYCGALGTIEIDHVIPISRGGANSIGNLVPACPSCNRSKSNRTIMEWRLARTSK